MGAMLFAQAEEQHRAHGPLLQPRGEGGAAYGASSAASSSSSKPASSRASMLNGPCR
jgi:hypothetical protein